MTYRDLNTNENNEKKDVRILLLEDDPYLSKFYQDRFKALGFDLLVEDDEDEGFDLAVSGRPDVIILDISLPKGDDFDFIERVKKHSEIFSTPIMVLTDLNDEYDKKRGLAAGAKEYLVRDDLPLKDVADKIRALAALNR